VSVVSIVVLVCMCGLLLFVCLYVCMFRDATSEALKPVARVAVSAGLLSEYTVLCIAW
jgi:hypothetical protein